MSFFFLYQYSLYYLGEILQPCKMLSATCFVMLSNKNTSDFHTGISMAKRKWPLFPVKVCSSFWSLSAGCDKLALQGQFMHVVICSFFFSVVTCHLTTLLFSCPSHTDSQLLPSPHPNHIQRIMTSRFSSLHSQNPTDRSNERYTHLEDTEVLPC